VGGSPWGNPWERPLVEHPLVERPLVERSLVELQLVELGRLVLVLVLEQLA
jgi:hypothetical protein